MAQFDHQAAGSHHGLWQPLPYIHSGFVIYPFHPETSPPPTPTTVDGGSLSLPPIPPQKDLEVLPWAGGRPSIGDSSFQGKRNAYEIKLDIGDEFYAFEEYRCTTDEDGRGDLWYRGFVVQAVSVTSLAPTPSSLTSSTQPASFPRPEPSVLTGIFPAAVCHVRPGSANDNGELSEAYGQAVKAAEERYRAASEGVSLGMQWVGEMGTVKEEEEEEEISSRASHAHTSSVGHRAVVEVSSEGRSTDALHRRRSSSRGSFSRPNRPMSLVLEQKKDEIEENKPQPPLPKLTAGDSTVSGQQWPLVDEIACAIREWYSRLPTYLANREYRLFSTVTQHIDALFLGRRQLLSQMLSGDELIRVRRECVSRLVKCNVAQGLDVIVRSLEDGSVVVVDRERAFSGTRWVGGISCYVYQVRLAYIDLIPLDKVFGKVFSFPGADSSQSPLSKPFSLAAAKTPAKTDEPAGTFHHLVLDVRAFIANPCAPGETAELYFSLWNKSDNRFITEEFVLVLNHLGSPARDAEQRLGRLRTMFTDLKVEDLGSDTYLVCKIVRNGALKMKSDKADGAHIQPPTTPKRTSLYGISEAGGTLRSHFQSPSSMNLTDDSFSVTSGYGPELNRPPTIDTTNGASTNGHSSLDSKPKFRRPLGVAVMLLPTLSKLISESSDASEAGVEKSVQIYVPKDEASFAGLHEDIVNKRVKQFGTSPRAESIVLNLTALKGSAPNLIRTQPSLLQNIPLTSRLSFPDVVFPDQTRSDLYINLLSAIFTPAPSTSNNGSVGGSIRVRKSVLSGAGNNGDIQVEMEVRTLDGTVIPEGIVPGGSGEKGVDRWESMVFHRNDRPTYNELVKVCLPSRPVDYHLFLTFRHRQKEKNSSAADLLEGEKPYAFAYIPLSGTSSVVRDGKHELVLYRMERGFQPTPNVYFDAPYIAKPGEVDPILPSSAAKTMVPLKDRVLLKTRLCSTSQTQDDTLRELFAWQPKSTLANEDLNLLCETLKLFAFVPEEEISHCVPRTLNSLFAILVSNLGERQDEVNGLVFRGLIKVLSITSDRRFPNFKSVLRVYINKIFSFPASSFHLLRSMKVVMSDPEAKDYRSFLKVWHLFFKFIIRSREQDRARGMGLDATSAHIEADYQKQTKYILAEINNLMLSSNKSLIGTQTLVVQHYADILPDLRQVFKPLEIAEMIIAFADTLAYTKGSIATYKLLLLLQVVNNVFDTSESRSLLVPALVRWVKPHLGRYDEYAAGMDASADARDARRIKWLECNRLAVTVLAWMVNVLQEWHVSALIQEDEGLKRQEEDNIEYCLTLLPALFASYSELSNPKTLEAIHRQRSSPTSPAIWKPTPDIFPTSVPFALVSQLPPPSLLERHHQAEADGLPRSEIFNCSLTECGVVITTLILATPRTNIERWFNEMLEYEGTETCSEVFVQIFDFAESIISFKAFPSQWLTLRLMCFSGILKALECIATVLEKPVFVPPPPSVSDPNISVEEQVSFDVDLWKRLFGLLCDFCGSPELALEEQTQQRRRAEWIVAGDLRDVGAGLLWRLWSAIGWPVDIAGCEGLRMGGHQTRFTGLAKDILRLCLSSHDALCGVAVEILFSILYAEHLLDQQGSSIQTEVFVTLDDLFNSKLSPSSSDPTMRAYFVAQLRTIFETTPQVSAPFTSSLTIFLSQVEHFIDLLLALREIPATPQWKDERSTATFQLMGFVSRIGMKDLYVRYVHELVQVCKETNDWLGAGLALKLHADVYEWNVAGEAWVQEGTWKEIAMPAQSQFIRKQGLYYHVMEYFALAESYEFSVDLCQELIMQHQKLTYDVRIIGELLQHQVKLWEKIASTWRPKVEYFRVAFFGDIPSLDKRKDYVVRAVNGQTFAHFCDKLQDKYRQATIHRSKIPPPESIKSGLDPVIWVMPLTPDPDLSKPIFSSQNEAHVPEPVQAYWLTNNIRRFSSMRPYLKDPGEREAVLTWTEKTIVTTKEDLPGLLARSEVINVRYEQIAPGVMATMEVERATKHLRKACRGKDGQLPEPKMLGTAINNAVDSPLSEGIRKYRQVFIEGDYATTHPQYQSHVEQLQTAIIDFVKAIYDSLEVHRQVCRDVPFHDALRTHMYRSFPIESADFPRTVSEDSHHILPSFSINGFPQAKLHSPIRSPQSVSIHISRDSGDSIFNSPSSPVAEQRLSVISAALSSNTSNYRLPPITLSPTEIGAESGNTQTPRDSVSTTRNTPTTPKHHGTNGTAAETPEVATPASSIGRSLSRSTSTRAKKEKRSSLTIPGVFGYGAGNNASVTSVGARARNMMGFGSRSTINVVHERMSEDEVPPLPPPKENMPEKGLKRLGSIMRRK
ncbi:hypothetical protein B9479_000260 [Cryptococcus floricola]|uniref:Cytoplasmic protein n=1 Tax=Cryptococcus floricola TaxID=2591691 RepID=A0A5D3B751_9TREE|nr:hypothetical protein B9479_000260 [Cryptococcus floricola]